MRISQPRPRRRPVKFDILWPGGADVAWDWNLTDQVGLRPVICKYHGLGRVRARPGAG